MKSLKQFSLVLFSMAVVSTAQAEVQRTVIWQKGTSEKAVIDQLFSDMSKEGIVDSSKNINVDLLAGSAAEKASEKGCFNGIVELGEAEFQTAFIAEWKKWFRQKHNLNAARLQWDAFQQIGKDYGGFVACDDVSIKAIIATVQKQQEVTELEVKVDDLTDKSMSAADLAEIKKFQEEIKEIKTGLEKVGGDVSKIQGQLSSLETRLDAFVKSTNSRLETLEAKEDVNATAIEELKKEVAYAKSLSQTNATNVNGLLEVAKSNTADIKKLQESEGASAMGSSVVVGVGAVLLLIVFVIACLALARAGGKSEKKPSKMAKGGQMPNGGKSAHSILEPVGQSDKAKA